MAKTLFVDFMNGADSKNGSTFENRVKTLNRASNLSAAGDIIKIMGNAPTDSRTNATWTNGSSRVDLASELTRTLYTDGAWTSADAKITASASAEPPVPRQGANYAKFVSAGFTTGKAAYLTLPSTQDLSEFQQLSFWIACTTGLTANRLTLDLCSDTTGDTIVSSFPITVALGTNKWTAISIDGKAALGGSIRSIRLTATSSINGKIILLDNIVACKEPSATDCLTLSSLVSPDRNVWYHVQSIDGKTIYLDGANTVIAAAKAKGYQGDTITSSLLLLQPTLSVTGDKTWAEQFGRAGTADSQITITGGWDAFDMATQTGLTVMDCMDSGSSAIRLTHTQGYVTVDGFAFVRCLEAATPDASANYQGISHCSFAGVSNLPDYLHGVTYSNSNIVNCGKNIIISSEGDKYVVDGCKIWGSVNPGIQCTAPGAQIINCDSAGSDSHGYDIAAKCKDLSNNSARKNLGRGFSMTDLDGVLAFNLKATGNGVAEVYLAAPGNNHINGLDTDTPGGSSVPQIVADSKEAILIESWHPYTGVNPAAILFNLGNPAKGRTAGRSIVAKKYQGDPARNEIYSDYGLVTTDGVESFNGSGPGWKFIPNANAFPTSPLGLLVGRVPCPANVQTTLTFYAKRNVAGGSARFRIIGGRYAGVGSVGSDVILDVIATDWTQHNIQFTPSENCVVEVFLEAWGATTETVTISGPTAITHSLLTESYVLSPGTKTVPTLRGALEETSALTYVSRATPFFVADPTTGYQYDKLGRLVKTIWMNAQVQSLSFDTMGNRTLITAN